MDEKIQVETSIDAPIEKVWELYNNPDHIIKWNSPSADWHTPKAVNDLKPGGKFVYRMEDKNTKEGFDFGGTYDEVVEPEFISYTMDDGRQVTVELYGHDEHTHMAVTFDPEDENTHEVQAQGWQAILDNFKKYVESQS